MNYVNTLATAQNSPSANLYQDVHLKFLCFWLAFVVSWLWGPRQHIKHNAIK